MAEYWQPGDVDPNVEFVYSISEPGSMGISRHAAEVIMGGVVVEVGSDLHDRLSSLGIGALSIAEYMTSVDNSND